ncbi:hypothetical protein GCM10023067_31840 [Aminobacter aganoensis]
MSEATSPPASAASTSCGGTEGGAISTMRQRLGGVFGFMFIDPVLDAYARRSCLHWGIEQSAAVEQDRQLNPSI